MRINRRLLRTDKDYVKVDFCHVAEGVGAILLMVFIASLVSWIIASPDTPDKPPQPSENEQQCSRIAEGKRWYLHKVNKYDKDGGYSHWVTTCTVLDQDNNKKDFEL